MRTAALKGFVVICIGTTLECCVMWRQAVLALTGKHAEAARKLLPDHLQEWGADVWQEQSSKVVISKFHMVRRVALWYASSL
jgi:hypothetical protein